MLQFPQERFDPEAPPAAGFFDFATRDDVFRSFLREARWQSGHAAACKAVYAGSIPTLASRTSFADIRLHAESGENLQKTRKSSLGIVRWLSWALYPWPG